MNTTRGRWVVLFLAAIVSSSVSLAPARANDIDDKEAFIKLLPRIEAIGAGVVNGPENARLFVLVAVDTDDGGGVTWGRDGLNMKALLEAGLGKQDLSGRYKIDLFTGKQCAPDKILAHMRGLNAGPNDAVLFYYSGHGATQMGRGHFMALTHGRLYRNDLIEAMNTGTPRLRVLLTDCCSNYIGLARPIEPRNVEVFARAGAEPQASTPVAVREEPKVSEINVVTRKPNGFVPRPGPGKTIAKNMLPPGTFPKAKVQEPVGYVFPTHYDGQARNFKLAKRTEPALGDESSAKLLATAGLPVLATHKGKVPMKTVLDNTDGEILRHLLFRHAGIVDIQGCQKGDSSFGTIAWGGSLFTNSLIALEDAKVTDFDRNNNRVVEWNEFFPQLQTSTRDAGSKLGGGGGPGGRVRQIPDGMQLGTPILP